MTFLTKKRSAQKRGSGGFTLIELLVVIAIIGVLASIVLASLNTARKKSRDTRRVADMSQARLALELYFDSNRVYPIAATSLVPTFIASWPTDPISGTAYVYKALIASPGIAGNGTCTDTPGGTCQYFHTGATVEDKGITAMASRAKRCPVDNVAPCLTAGGYSLLTDTPIYGTNLDLNCANGTATGQGCYDVTP